MGAFPVRVLGQRCEHEAEVLHGMLDVAEEYVANMFAMASRVTG
ncbi:hypothetical protein [Saccharopolyspora pogona]|nr:hypothetical protein [Saccharopolyspora pogona]